MENKTDTEVATETPQATPEQIMELKVSSALEAIRNSITRKEDDPNQTSLVDAVQQSKSVLLDYAMLAYASKPKDPKMLEAVTGLLAQIEKTVRDDRKEKAKAEDKEDDKISFNQMLDAMKQISSGAIVMPTFELGNFLLDPNKSLTELTPTSKPITPEELTQGNGLVDIDGKQV